MGERRGQGRNKTRRLIDFDLAVLDLDNSINSSNIPHMTVMLPESSDYESVLKYELFDQNNVVCFPYSYWNAEKY